MYSDDLRETDCAEVRRSLLAERELTAAERAHAEACEACADAVMETEIEAALMVKPPVIASEWFAARVVMQLPSERGVRRWARQKLAHGRRLRRHIGRNAAVALLLVMMTVLAMIDPRWLMGTGPVRMTLMLMLVGEVAGIALWMGLRHEA